MLKKFITTLAGGLLLFSANAQIRIYNTRHSQDTLKTAPGKDSSLLRKSRFLPIPVLGYAPEKGLEIGAAVLYSFYLDKENPVAGTRNSTIIFIPSLTTEHQYKADIKADFWSPGNLWHYKGQLRYHDFPINFYGIGSDTREADKTLLDNKRFKFLAEVERRLLPQFYAGLSLQYQYDEYSAAEDKGIYPQMNLVDKNGGHSTFLGVSAIYDNRNNQNYTTRGSFLRANAAYALDFLSTRPFWKLEGKASHFFAISKKSTVGINGQLNSVQGDALPFYMLSELGSDYIMRGYYPGRYRDQNFAGIQAEYRFLIDPKLGLQLWSFNLQPKFALAVFGGTGAVFTNHNIALDKLKPNYGLGLRYFYDENSRLSIRIDYGWGEKAPGEKRQQGFYLSIGEAF
ncbi:polymerase [Chitinophaga caeni]|uniref:Polymerase n=1 Tax=Chitinophaga caeni TaxID=2029983 RepID=A0A291QRJ3_9BACT|nr:BamA/TamA family outer membrane protein [Chitinophaga caeni]ATL46546.1 polymerase [Chitinophaga caeni]